MKNYPYQNTLIGKKQLRHLLAWSFTNYDSMKVCGLADELKYLGFQYATQAGISLSIEDLKIPFIKNLMLNRANQEILNSEKIYLNGKITEVERFQKIIDTWNLTSESLKEHIIYYFKNYDPLNSVYIMAFSGARGNLSQVRQLVGMRGLMSDPNGEILNLPIKKNFREGLTITDYLMSGYGARKGIIDTALKTANSGYLTRRLIDVAQDILIREKDCLTKNSFLVTINSNNKNQIFEKLLGRVLTKPIYDSKKNKFLAFSNSQINTDLIDQFYKSLENKFYIRSPLTCNLYRAICQKCYGWDLANENLVDIGEAVGILAGQSIGEPGTQLTMRTFHTGGIFTTEARQQILSPFNGIIRFYKFLKTVLLRTNRGEDVLITKNSGSLILIPENSNQDFIQIELLRNTILFPKNNQYILKDTVIAELINQNKQIKTDIKPILTDSCGEIFLPRLKKKVNLRNNNRIIWILEGKFYSSPKNSFINFFPDYKINQKSYIFRTKIINQSVGSLEFFTKQKNLYQRVIQINNKKYLLENCSLQKLIPHFFQKNYLLNIKQFKYLIQIKKKESQFYIQITRTNHIGILLINTFKTLTGGFIYYDYRSLIKFNKLQNFLFYAARNFLNSRYQIFTYFKTIIWFGKEIHRLNCESNILLVENGDFISKGFELVPGLFSKTCGIVKIRQKSNIIQTLEIKSGFVYEGKNLKSFSRKLYYPGEILFSHISIKTLSFCDHFLVRNIEQLLVCPIEIFEIPHSKNLNFNSKYKYLYKSNQFIKGTKNLKLVANTLNFTSKKNGKIEIINSFKNKKLSFNLIEKIHLNNYILPSLKYKNIESSLLIQSKQFMDCYTILGYIESITLNSLEIVKIKLKYKTIKQILLITNENCFTIRKSKFFTKKLTNSFLYGNNINEIGKIITENKKFFIVQKGKPYFFPNCITKELRSKSNLQYKIISQKRSDPFFKTSKLISLNYFDFLKYSFYKKIETNQFLKTKNTLKAEFSKIFFKKNGKFYSSMIPHVFKRFTITSSRKSFKTEYIFQPKLASSYSKINRTLLLHNLKFTKNPYTKFSKINYQLLLVKFLNYPFQKTTKSIGIYSITEDFFEKDANSVFCKNSEFIEKGKTIGLLKLEKEITGDIVQGLPRIEEILEARKKYIRFKRMPISKKKGLLIQKTNLDTNFEFQKLATPLQENEKTNPHKLLKVYFNYYGLKKAFVCDRTKKIKYNRLISNYEGSYKSFKKVQAFILNSVQAVYKSQGVTINDKHLEVIIKQMTTKVLITYEGNTPLLRQEVIDLYHIQYINQIVKIQKKKSAYYVPLLLGITKAAINNPSFISAASFQETTRVLTKAAIEGRIDWLRGLKENIIIGHLIPSGTGSQNYCNCFQKKIFN